MGFTLGFQRFPAPAGDLEYAHVPWDSELYGFPFYELRCGKTPSDIVAQFLPSWLASLPTDRPCLVYAKVPTQTVALGKVLTQHGFYPVETLLGLSLPLARITPIAFPRRDQTRLRRGSERDLPELSEIARTSFQFDRLHLDPHLPPGKADQRFANWIERGIRDGDTVFAYEDVVRDHVMGFVHVREIIPKHLDLSLGAVGVPYQHAGVGVAMFQDVLAECHDRGYQIASTWTPVNNRQMVNLLVRLGFTIRDAVATFHWFSPGTGENSGSER